MENTGVAQKVLELVVRELELDSDQRIGPTAKFVDDLGADSLRIFALITAIEEEFDISIDDSAVEGIVTVSDAVNLVERMLGAGGRP